MEDSELKKVALKGEDEGGIISVSDLFDSEEEVPDEEPVNEEPSGDDDGEEPSDKGEPSAPEEEEPGTEEEDEGGEDEGDLIEELSNFLAQEPEAKEEPKPKEEPGEGQPPVELPVEKFVDEKEMEVAFDTPDNFNKLLTKVVHRAVQTALQGVPVIVGATLTKARQREALVEQFYRKNKDLEEIKPLVAVAVNRLASNNPPAGDKELMELLEKAGEQARRMYKMILKKRKSGESEKRKSGRKLLPGTKRRAAPAKGDLSPQEREIIETLSLR